MPARARLHVGKSEPFAHAHLSGLIKSRTVIGYFEHEIRRAPAKADIYHRWSGMANRIADIEHLAGLATKYRKISGMA